MSDDRYTLEGARQRATRAARRDEQLEALADRERAEQLSEINDMLAEHLADALRHEEIAAEIVSDTATPVHLRRWREGKPQGFKAWRRSTLAAQFARQVVAELEKLKVARTR